MYRMYLQLMYRLYLQLIVTGYATAFEGHGVTIVKSILSEL